MNPRPEAPPTRRMTRRLVLLAAVLALVIGAGWLLSGAADALVPVPGVCIYYSDATFTQVVGARGTGCCGQPINWGITTSFKRCEQLYCPDVVCPD